MIDITKLKRIRKEMKRTQVDIAKSCNIAEPYYSEIETGKKTPSLRTAVNLAKSLGVSVDQLLK